MFQYLFLQLKIIQSYNQINRINRINIQRDHYLVEMSIKKVNVDAKLVFTLLD